MVRGPRPQPARLQGGVRCAHHSLQAPLQDAFQGGQGGSPVPTSARGSAPCGNSLRTPAALRNIRAEENQVWQLGQPCPPTHPWSSKARGSLSLLTPGWEGSTSEMPL